MNAPTIIAVIGMIILTINQWKLKKRGWAYAFATAGLILIIIGVLQELNILPQK